MSVISAQSQSMLLPNPTLTTQLSRLVVFDIDDVTWDAQGRAAEWVGVKFEDLVEFHILKNERMTTAQREAMNNCYRNPQFYQNIEFYPGFEQIMELEQHGAILQFNSNNFAQEVADSKKSQIRAKVPGTRPEMYQFNIVDGSTTIKKKFPDESFIVIDDSPYNIALSPAPYNIMPTLPWNWTTAARALVAQKVVYYTPQGDMQAIYRIIRRLLASSQTPPV